MEYWIDPANWYRGFKSIKAVSDRNGLNGGMLQIFTMRRSVRLAARAINEVTSEASAGVLAQTSRSQTIKEDRELSAKERITQKPNAAKRTRKSSTTVDPDDLKRGAKLKNVTKEENTKPKVKRVKTEQGEGAVSTSEENVYKAPFLQEKLIGAHVSISGGIQNAVAEALAIGAKAFGLFLRSQRQWVSKPLEDKAAELFREACVQANFSPDAILPHGIYLMNCGSPEEETLGKSRATLVDELKRCEKLGLTLYNFHPGSTCGKISVDECLDRIAESVNQAHKETKHVITVLENMSCQGNTVGRIFYCCVCFVLVLVIFVFLIVCLCVCIIFFYLCPSPLPMEGTIPTGLSVANSDFNTTMHGRKK